MTATRSSRFIVLLAASALFASAQDDTSDRKRAISNNLASALSDTMPKYNPPPPEPEEKDDGVDEDMMLKPKNGIVRLPRVVVEGTRPPIFTERQVYTDKGLNEIATKRYFADASQALNKFNVPFLSMSQADLAMMMWEEDERLRMLDDLNGRSDQAALFGDEATSKEIREMTRDALTRSDYLPDASALHRETATALPRKSNP
ncbi:hypothetical protein [Synoicihabitans lomoniglobus]|uniref:Uncharacterized protein n=1 Tax=Synoicihabitans lomoniglobus TaxID=2909285 RepID=A0AAE9ZUZ5_9BACT|nr:hypothetical protein [Opitutaceae bacterium LMO-M01]WED63579.1 hypothetical protein PXH66_14680 [Opitutaceae bacterium LMO-M01]